MTNFDQNNQESIAKFVLDNLPRHDTLALATISSGGLPWVVCVNLTFDNEMNIYWKSAKSSEHSKNIATHDDVSICIFSHSQEVGDFGFYCIAKAHQILDESELEHALDVKYRQKGLDVPNKSDFAKDSTRGMYCAVISKAWVNDNRHTKTRVDMATLKELAKIS